MRTPKTIRNSLFATGLMLAFAAVPFAQASAQDAGGSMQQSSNQTVPDKAADAWITTKVKSEFGTTSGVSATDITVSTSDGVVSLSGNVASQAEKAKAEQIAQGIKGVKSVNSSGLNVGGTANPQ